MSEKDEHTWTARCEQCPWTYTTTIRAVAEVRLIVHHCKDHATSGVWE